MIARTVAQDDPVFGRELVVPHTCPCCEKCWLILKSGKRPVGSCVYGGPYRGYVEVT